jgi:hypothetical protein
MHCSNCGQKNPPGVSTCILCGRGISSELDIDKEKTSPIPTLSIENGNDTSTLKKNMFGYFGGVIILISYFLPFFSYTDFGFDDGYVDVALYRMVLNGLLVTLSAIIAIVLLYLGRRLLVRYVSIFGFIVLIYTALSVHRYLSRSYPELAERDDNLHGMFIQILQESVQYEIGFYLLFLGFVLLFISSFRIGKVKNH